MAGLQVAINHCDGLPLSPRHHVRYYRAYEKSRYECGGYHPFTNTGQSTAPPQSQQNPTTFKNNSSTRRLTNTSEKTRAFISRNIHHLPPPLYICHCIPQARLKGKEKRVG